MRRTVGIGGAAAVALGAAMVLALPASAHNHSDSAGCYGSTAVFSVNLENYNSGVTNTVTITDNGTTVVDGKTFGSSYNTPVKDDNATIEHTFKITVVAGDDKPNKDGMGRNGFSFVDSQTSPVCVKETSTPPPTTTTTTPPPPPSSSTSATPPPATTTSEAVVAAATTTPAGPPGAATLPNTGVNAGLPLGIAGGLVVIGGGILFWLRFSSRRKTV
jgi:LPXTG-motif cell wall-anchored protein